MKTINKIFSIIACCLVMASCNDESIYIQENDSWQGNDKISLSLTAAPEFRANDTRAVDVPVDEGTATDYHISDFVLFQFDENGNRIVDPKYYEYTPDTPGDPGQTIPVVLPTADGVEYTVVVLANIHGNLTTGAFADATTLSKLMEKYQKFEELSDSYKSNGSGYDLLMNGFAKISKSTSTLNVELFRNVAKLTINITNTVGSGVIIKTAQVKQVPTKIDYFYHLIESLNPTALEAPYPLRSSFTTFDYNVDEFTVNPGENHQLTYYLPCHIMGESAASSEKTKGVNAPDYATFVELYGVSEDGMKYSRYRFYLGDNMTNDYNIRPNYHYTLPLTFNKIGDPQNDPRVKIVSAVVEEPDANSYIINPLPIEQQRMYNIPAVDRINTFWQNEFIANHISSSTAYTIMSDNQWKAEIIWQTSSEQMIEFYNADGTITENEGRIAPVYTGKQAIRFKPKKGAAGNVLIGVYRTDQPNASDPDKREYSWSWHLWITDYNPDECRNQNWDGRYKLRLSNGSGEVHHYTGAIWNEGSDCYNKWVMDRNLGALTNEGCSNESIGTYYQYGSNIPYLVQNVYRYNISTNTYDLYKRPYTVSYSSTNTLTYIVSHPMLICTGSSDFIYDNPYFQNEWNDPDWSIGSQGGETKKSFFDPCPPGWRIPSIEIWRSIVNYCGTHSNGLPFYFDGIMNSENVAWYPGGGDLSGYNQFGSTTTYWGRSLVYYSYEHSANGTPYELYTHVEGRATIGGYRGRPSANSIRPIQE